MKKITILLFTFVFSLMFRMNVFAANENEASSIYMLTEACPNEAIQYAKDNWQSYLANLSQQDISYENIDVTELKLGSPFKMLYEGGSSYTPVYFFPIISEDSIIFTLRVYEDTDGLCKGIMGEDLVEELTGLVDNTTESNPALLFVNNGNILMTLNNETSIIVPDRYGKELVNSVSACSLNELDVTNIMEAPTSGVDAEISANSFAEIVSPLAQYNTGYISLDLLETQGATNWCAAYCASSIIRRLTNYDVYAQDLINYTLFGILGIIFMNPCRFHQKAMLHQQVLLMNGRRPSIIGGMVPYISHYVI